MAFQMCELLTLFDIRLFHWVMNPPRSGAIPSASYGTPASPVPGSLALCIAPVGTLTVLIAKQS